MNSASVHKSFLNKFRLKSPLVFTFHINWKVYENLGVQQFEHVKTHFKRRGIDTFEFLPILTDKKTDMEQRIKQFKRGIERIVDKYERKAHVVGYSFAGIIPRGYIGLYNGDDYISSLLTISTPHQGCRFVDFLISKDYSNQWYVIEPAIRNTGVHKDWLMDEYSSKTLHDNSQMFLSSPSVKYYSVGGNRMTIKCSESLRVIAEDLSDSLKKDYPNDGLICSKETEFGEHLVNYDADHFEMIGMRPNFNAEQLFDLYTQTVTSSDEDFMNILNDINTNPSNSNSNSIKEKII